MTPASGRRVIHTVLLPLIGLFIGSVAARAQGVTGGTIHGRILGPDSVPVPEATVLVTNTSNGERWRTITGGGGDYQVDHLSVGGPYLVEVRAIGLAPERRAGVLLSLGQRHRLDFALRSTVSVLDSITVRADDDPLINAGRTGPSQTISDSTLARLPIRGRDLLTVARLAPLVTGSGAIAGQNDRLTAVQIDGAAGGDLLGGVRTPGQGFGLKTAPVEIVKEVQVLAAPFDVRYGSLSAGVVNVVTRSGSNRLEGAVSGYYTARGLQGKDETGSRGEDFTGSDVNLALGGPIVRDRAAFFLEAGRQHVEFPLVSPIIGTDTTGGADSAATGFRRASVQRLQEVMRDVYGIEAGGTDPYPVSVPVGNVFGKLTLQLGVNSRLDLSHQYSRSTPDLLDIGCRVRGQFCLGSTAFQLAARAHISRLAWVTAPARGLSNDLLLARSWFRQSCGTTDFPLVFVHADAGDLGAGGNSLCVGDRVEEEILELTDNLTLQAGTHRVTFGAHGELIRLPTHENLAFAFAPAWHFQSLDSLAAGMPDRYGGILEHPARDGAPLSDLRTRLISPYIQDQWSVTPRLVLTAGLRADVPSASRRPTRNPALAELGVDNTVTPSGQVIWSPRVGVSYDLSGNGRTLLRGGLGLFTGRPAYRWLNEVYAHTGLDAVFVDCDSTNVPAFTRDVHRQPTTCAAGGDLSPVAGPVNVFDPGFRFPRALKVAVGADHRLPWGFVGTVDLLFSRAVNQLDLRDLNLTAPEAEAFGEAGRLLYGTIGDDGLATPNRRSPAFGRVIEVRNGSGDRSFAVTAQLQKHFDGGKEFGLSYTYTSARDRLSASEDGLDGNLDAVVLDGSLEGRRLAPSVWSVPHRVTLLATTDLPLRFRMTLFYQGASGGPFTYSVDGDPNADGYLNDPMYVPVDAAPGGDIELVVDDDQGQLIPAPPSVYAELDRFIEQQPCLSSQRGRVLRRNSCQNSWTNLVDARLSRIFSRGGGRSLELTLDVFNVLHLLDADWGLIRGVDDTPLVQLAGYDAAHGRGIYQFLRRTTRSVDSDASRWRMQLGARISF